MQLLLIILSSLLFLCGIYFYIQSKRKCSQLQHIVSLQTSELKKNHLTEKKLLDEVNNLQNKLNHTFSDKVTHLLGWKLFEDRLLQGLKESERYQLNMAVLCIDLDDFKIFNEVLGYEVGDQLLKITAERLQSCIRQVDSISRFTEDTFFALLTQLSKPETAAIVAQRILQALAEPFIIEEQELYITACIGIAVYPTDAHDAQSLLHHAEHALHLAKAKGKHIYQFYQEKLHSISARELALVSNLNSESIYDELIIYYQPIVDIKNERIVCLDALLHWQHAQIGLVKPDELFCYAGKQHKLNAITEWLLQAVCKQYQHWVALGFDPAMIGIPVSFTQLENSQFIYRLSQILQEQSVDPKQILLELQESPSQLSFDVLEKAFNMLTFIGVNIALQFGAGHFPLAQLKKFPIQYLRLDQILIDDVAINEQTVALIRSLVALAKNLKIQLIVQGIESEEQMIVLAALDCTWLQGNLLGRPLRENEMTQKMLTA